MASLRDFQRLALLLTCALGLVWAGGAQAQSDGALEMRLQQIEARLEDQGRRLADQERLIAEQRTELATLRAEREVELAATRAGSAQPAEGQVQRTASETRPTGGQVQRAAVEDQVPNAVTEGLPNRPVGAPPPADTEAVRAIAALPDQVAVLTPRGQFVLDPSVEYSRSSSNRLVFRGVEIVSGIQLGVIEANDADRDSAVATGAFRYGLTRRLGFSLLDMKLYLEARGFRADGYRATLDQLMSAKVPAIAVISSGAYRHFVVIKGAKGDKILVGDPSQGLRVYSRKEFQGVWNGVLFAIRPGADDAPAYNVQADWTPRGQPPLGERMSDASLSAFTRDLAPIYQVTTLVRAD